MTRPDLHTREWRDLPRDGECVAEFLFGEAAGPCRGLMHRHHVVPRDPSSRSYQACARHHPTIEAFLRRLTPRPYRRFSRNHTGAAPATGTAWSSSANGAPRSGAAARPATPRASPRSI